MIAERLANGPERLKWLLLFLVAAAAFGPFYGLQPVANLDGQAHWALAVIVFALACWIFYPRRLPRGVAGVLMMGLLLLGNLPYEKVFSGFTSSAIWIVIPAFLFGYAIQLTGLGKRVTVWVLKRCRGSVVSVSLALTLIGIVFSLLTPSITVRMAIIMPLVYNIIIMLGLRKQSEESAFLALVAFTAIMVPGNGWLTGSLAGPINMGLLTPELREGLDWFTYSRALVVPWLVITALILVYLFFIFRPGRLQKGIAFCGEQDDLQPLSSAEVRCATILGATFLGYLTTPFHGLEAVTITAVALFLLFVSGVLSAGAISEGINWDIVLLIGSIMGLPAVFDAIGLTDLLADLFLPVMTDFAYNIYLFLLVLISLVLLTRFLDVVFGLPTVAVMMAFAPRLAELGIHPLVLCTVSGMIQCFTITHYMSPFAIISNQLLQGYAWSERHLFYYGLGYLLAVYLSIFPSVWYWGAIGIQL